MSKQSMFRIIKRWKRYQEKEKLGKKTIPAITRGVYVLYKKISSDYEVRYIGVAGVSKEATRGIGGRLRDHKKNANRDWTHYSFFEVHDNVMREDILELESLLLAIFRDDPRIKLENKQKGSSVLSKLRKNEIWENVKGIPKRGSNSVISNKKFVGIWKNRKDLNEQFSLKEKIK